jgi:hypothetical protein
LDLRQPHQAGDPAAADRNPQQAELPRHPGTAV